MEPNITVFKPPARSNLNTAMMYWDTTGYDNISGAYQSASTLQTCRDEIHEVVARRRELVDSMFGENLTEIYPDRFTQESTFRYRAISEKGLHTSTEHALRDTYECTWAYVNKDSL